VGLWALWPGPIGNICWTLVEDQYSLSSELLSTQLRRINLYFLFCLFRWLAPYATDCWTMDELNNLPIQNSYLNTALSWKYCIYEYICQNIQYITIYMSWKWLGWLGQPGGQLVVLVVVLITINRLSTRWPDDLKSEVVIPGGRASLYSTPPAVGGCDMPSQVDLHMRVSHHLTCCQFALSWIFFCHPS
jgi:hypothetical protein